MRSSSSPQPRQAPALVIPAMICCRVLTQALGAGNHALLLMHSRDAAGNVAPIECKWQDPKSICDECIYVMRFFFCAELHNGSGSSEGYLAVIQIGVIGSQYYTQRQGYG